MPHKRNALGGNGLATARRVHSGDEWLPAERCIDILRLMVRARTMEERMIKMSKSGHGFFWIGGPGEEAFNTCLGLQVKKGEGPAFDYLHLHYRSGAALLAMGMSVLDGIRQMAMTIRDPHSMGRNFPSHFARRAWNVVPISSVVGVQWVKAPGTAHVQERFGGDGITIVSGGDAGTAEGDFASCMIWSTRPGHELPILMIVMNNNVGISTPACTQHSERHIIDRGKAFGIPGEVVDGRDPIASWHAIERGTAHCRLKRKPYLLEAMVSRMYGHSSSSGAVRVRDELDAVPNFEQKLLEIGAIEEAGLKEIHDEVSTEAEAALEQALEDAPPSEEDVARCTYAPSEVDVVYPGDYTGLPG